ncbi:MAG: hypothetical protein K2I49_02790 [Ureaplasma sp.]|nr:hypothetical protein [Ureaplasma sp.]
MVTNSNLLVGTLFPNIDDQYRRNLPYLPLVNSLNLDNNIKYIFNQAAFNWNFSRTNNIENSEINYIIKELLFINRHTILTYP